MAAMALLFFSTAKAAVPKECMSGVDKAKQEAACTKFLAGKKITINERADALFQRGFARYHQNGKEDLAFEDAAEVLKLMPNWSGGFYLRANLHTWKQNYDKAIADYTIGYSLAVAKLKNTYLKSRASVHALKEDYSKAIADMTLALASEQTAQNYFDRAGYHLLQKNIKQAIVDYTAAIIVRDWLPSTGAGRHRAFARHQSPGRVRKCAFCVPPQGRLYLSGSQPA